MAGNPLSLFPGFSALGLVSSAVLEAATVFNSEGLDALSGIPESALAWAEVGTRVTGGIEAGQAKIPVRLSPLHGFEPKTNVRSFSQVLLASITAKVNEYDLNYEWPLPLAGSGAAQFYGLEGLAGDIISAARALKPDLVASILMNGFTSATIAAAASALGVEGATGAAVTIPQPGYPLGLPLFSGGIASDGTTELTAKHFSNPMLSASPRFPNLFYGIGKIGDSACARTVTGYMSATDSVFGTMLTKMSQVPHPSKYNMTMGLEVTHIVGPTWMKIPFWEVAVRELSLQVANPTGSTYVAGATTNPFSSQRVRESGPSALVGASGVTPWQFHIAPQLDAHPYALANPGKQFWFAISTSKKNLCFAELAAPTKEFSPRVVLFGENTENAKMHNKIQLLGDMAAGGAAGLPHCIQMYTETAPAT